MEIYWNGINKLSYENLKDFLIILKIIYKANKQEPYLSYILNGIKIVEGRLNKGKFKEMKAGDIIETSDQRFLIKYKKEYKVFLEI